MNGVWRVLLVAAIAQPVNAVGDADEIKSLPNVTFKFPYKMYSGYLNGNKEGTFRMFYWLVESYTTPESAPLLLWLSGGPGCSSVSGGLEELGPFYVNKDAHSMFQHVYAWNRYANVLYIESPVGVGFSYNTKDFMNFTVGDDMTAELNRHALADFFNRVQPKYKNREFFVSGESYGGIYIPTLSRVIIRGINDGSFPNPNFHGMMIGNGYCNVKDLANSMILFHNYHGRIGVSDWETIKKSCCMDSQNTMVELDKCDFYASMTINNTVLGPQDNACGSSLSKFILMPKTQDEYNFYQDCYKDTVANQANRLITREINNAARLNYDSTDNQDGYPCFDDTVTLAYMNEPEVLKAFHVDEQWIKDPRTSWKYCNDPLFDVYPVTYRDTLPVFNDIINEVKIPKFRILIYNGDVDTACNFLGDAWHFENVAKVNKMTANTRTPWQFRKQIAGYQQRYTHSKLTLDVITVKGAGHFVPLDRPGPSLQMITNFMKFGTPDYSSTKEFDDMPMILPAVDGATSPRFGGIILLLITSVVANFRPF